MKYTSTYGLWEVKTEGDVEGRSVRNLGTFEGHVDEIALHLANQCYYSLHFTWVKPVKKFVPKTKEVSVQFDIDSGTWDMKNDTLKTEMSKLFKDRPVTIKNSNYFASFAICSDSFDPEKIKNNIKNKLTPEELEFLKHNNSIDNL